jgi:hypothetical protein
VFLMVACSPSLRIEGCDVAVYPVPQPNLNGYESSPQAVLCTTDHFPLFASLHGFPNSILCWPVVHFHPDSTTKTSANQGASAMKSSGRIGHAKSRGVAGFGKS